MTDLGKLVLPLIERTIAAADAIRFHAHEYQRKGIAPLKVAIETSVSARVLVDPLSELAAVVPGLQVELLEAPVETIPALLLDGNANVAISGIPDTLPPRIHHWRLFEERFMVLTAAGADLRHHDVIPLRALADAVWIERIGCPVWRRFRVDHFPNTQEPKIAHRGQQESHLQHMVAAGLGIMIAPEHAPCLPSLIARPLAEDTVWREVHMLVVSGRRRSPALDAFIKALRLRDWKQAQGAVRARGSARRPPRPAEAGTASAAEDSAGENECGDCSTGTTPT